MQVVLNVPDQFFLDLSVSELAQKLKLSTALLMFKAKQISIGAACELADVDLYTFMEACYQNGIEIINHDPNEVEADLLRLLQGEN